MKLGIYTPTHAPRYLEAAARSILRQLDRVSTGIDVQWLVLLNGGVTSEQLPAAVRELGPWVRIVDHPPSEPSTVGNLKGKACRLLLEYGVDALVELDHDDELAANCLEALAGEFEKGADFVGSNCGAETRFGAEYGWRSESAVVEGHRCWVNETPLVSSRSLAEIFSAPNHVRAWSRKGYQKAGGYDPTLAVADDHDLLCKTYVAGCEMVQLPGVLYLQREHPDQTQAKLNAQIQQQQAQVGGKHLYALAQEEARRRGLPMYDLGSAHDSPPGYLGVDIRDGADVQCDVEQGLPLATSSAFVIRAHDFLEHIRPDRVVAVMNEIYRVLAPGGWLLTSTPSTDGRGAWQDPTHRSGWNANSFWYYTRAELAQYVPEIACRFQAVRVVDHHPSPWHELHRIPYVDAALWALKGQDTIGQVLI